MTIRRQWVAALAVIALAGWRLATPVSGEAVRTSACGTYLCASQCSDADLQCAECPGYVCLGRDHWPCPFFELIYCDDIT